MPLSLTERALLLGLLALFISPIGPYKAYMAYRLLALLDLFIGPIGPYRAYKANRLLALLGLFIGPISLIGPIRLIDYLPYKANS